LENYCGNAEATKPSKKKTGIDVRRGAVVLDKFVEVFDWAAKQLAIGEAIHDGILVKGLDEAWNVADA
jgi:hypothetical protein